VLGRTSSDETSFEKSRLESGKLKRTKRKFKGPLEKAEEETNSKKEVSEKL